MGLLSNRRRYGEKLPYDYKVDYIAVKEGSEEYAWIDIDYQLKGNNYILSIEWTQIGYSNIYNNPVFYGNALAIYNNHYYLQRAGGNNTFLIFSSNDSSFRQLYTYGAFKPTEFKRYTFTINTENKNDSYVLIADVKTVITNLNYNEYDTSSIVLFSPDTSFDGRYYPINYMRLHSFRLIDKGVLVRDMIPVVKDGIGYMYDKVTKKLFGALGDGNFEFGSKIK